MAAGGSDTAAAALADAAALAGADAPAAAEAAAPPPVAEEGPLSGVAKGSAAGLLLHATSMIADAARTTEFWTCERADIGPLPRRELGDHSRYGRSGRLGSSR